MRGVLLHVMGDALGSVAVIVSAVIIWQCEGSWRFYSDPVCSLIIVVIIVAGTWPLVKESAQILLQRSPEGVDTMRVKRKILKDDDILQVHCFHVWTLSSTKIVASMHLVMLEGTDFMRVSDRIKVMLHKYGLHANTIQPELVKNREVRTHTHIHTHTHTYIHISATSDMKMVLCQDVNSCFACQEPLCESENCTRNMCCQEDDQIHPETHLQHRTWSGKYVKE